MGKYILAVDDEAHIRRLVQLNLQRLGHRIATACDGVEALEMIRQERPDLIVLDITMPRMDGFALLQKLRADPEYQDLDVILLTARGQDADVFEGRSLGVHYYLHKPFNPIELADTVRELFERLDGGS